MSGARGECHVETDAAVASLLVDEGEGGFSPAVPAPHVAHGVVFVYFVPNVANLAPGSVGKTKDFTKK